MGSSGTTPDFDALYASDPDPWDVAQSWYERRKIDLVLATLRRPRYRLAWDTACGTGDLAAALAPRCERVVASDASARACELTAATVAGCEEVVVEHSALPDAPAAVPPGTADLVVVSEVLYYLSPDQRAASHRRIAAACAPSADVLAVHWAPRPEDAHLSGAAAQRELNDHLVGAGWTRLVTHTDIEFVLVLWSRDVPETIGR